MFKKPIVVFHHSKDLDGIYSKIALDNLSKVYRGIDFADIELNDVSFFNAYKDFTLLFIDVSPRVETLNELLDNNFDIIIIDHHETAYNDYKDIDRENFAYYYNTIDSACLMAYNILCGQYSQYTFNKDILPIINTFNKKEYEFFSMISCQDTWKWAELKRYSCLILQTHFNRVNVYEVKIPLFRKIYAMYLESNCFDVDVFLYTLPMLKDSCNFIYRKMNEEYKGLEINFNGHKSILTMNPPDYIIQERLFNMGYEVILFIRHKLDNKVNISLRTKSDNIHLGNLSKSYFNGGGHQKASGARISSEMYVKFVNEYNSENKTFEVRREIREYLEK